MRKALSITLMLVVALAVPALAKPVDETGGQIAVFGRIGSRPFTREEQLKFYLRPDGTPWTVSDWNCTAHSQRKWFCVRTGLGKGPSTTGMRLFRTALSTGSTTGD